jgi:excisionase family DNA binding protein
MARSPNELEPLAVTVKTACRLLDVGDTTVWAMIKDGRLKGFKLGGKRLIEYASLKALIKEGQAPSNPTALGG